MCVSQFSICTYSNCDMHIFENCIFAYIRICNFRYAHIRIADIQIFERNTHFFRICAYRTFSFEYVCIATHFFRICVRRYFLFSMCISQFSLLIYDSQTIGALSNMCISQFSFSFEYAYISQWTSFEYVYTAIFFFRNYESQRCM